MDFETKLAAGFFTVGLSEGDQIKLYTTKFGADEGLRIALNPDEARELRKYIKKHVLKP